MLAEKVPKMPLLNKNMAVKLVFRWRFLVGPDCECQGGQGVEELLLVSFEDFWWWWMAAGGGC